MTCNPQNKAFLWWYTLRNDAQHMQGRWCSRDTQSLVTTAQNRNGYFTPNIIMQLINQAHMPIKVVSGYHWELTGRLGKFLKKQGGWRDTASTRQIPPVARAVIEEAVKQTTGGVFRAPSTYPHFHSFVGLYDTTPKVLASVGVCGRVLPIWRLTAQLLTTTVYIDYVFGGHWSRDGFRVLLVAVVGRDAEGNIW